MKRKIDRIMYCPHMLHVCDCTLTGSFPGPAEEDCLPLAAHTTVCQGDHSAKEKKIMRKGAI